MNKLIIIGNLTANPEVRYVDTANGQQAVCNFTVAVNRYIRDRKITDYFRVSCWNRQAENAERYLAKGSKVAVTGPITARSYTTRDGKAGASLELSAETIEYLSPVGSHNYSAPDYQDPSAGMDGFENIPEGRQGELPFH